MLKRFTAFFLLCIMLLALMPMQTQAASSFVGYPSVFVTEDNYRISFLTNTNGMAWVEIGGVAYEDTTCGIMDWETKFHGITVPQSVLNAAKSYTICFRPLASRPANNPAPGAKETKTYSFNPVLPGEDPVLLCVSDQHNNNSGAVAAAKYAAFDALVFGGDYTGHISTETIAQDFLKYSGNIAKGTKPVIYPRGNHEIRGQYTHWIDEVMPTSETGKSYYEFVMGDIYGIVLDCGGSYTDNYTDIADTIDFEPYRVEQTRWLEKVYAKGTWRQYDKRVIFSHVPFITQANFTDVFTDWTKILNKMDMSLLVSGHTHNFTFYGTTHSSVKTGPNFPAFTMTAYKKDPYTYTGGFLTLGDQSFTIKQVDSASLSVKSTHTVTNKTYGITREPVTEFVTARADLLAPVVSTGTASVPSVSSPFSAHPTVFIVEDNYEISFLTTGNGMGWVEIGGKKYKDSTMGVMDWESRIHKVTVPQSVLNQAKAYKICFQSMTERAAYTPVHGSTVSRTYPFTPAPAVPTYLCMSEQLNENANALKVAQYKAWDVFVCGGKYMKAANTENNRYYLLTLCGETTQGTKPTIFTRGNRELRGFGAHDVIDSMGTSSTGDAYFYFTQPNIFGIVLDTGEYGADTLAQFGDTVRFQKYREKQTQWLKQIYAEGKWKDYNTRIVICHLPFTAYTDGTMKAVFKEWTNILNQMGVTLMIAGHVNNYSFYPVGDSRNVSGPTFPMLTMSDLDNGDYAYSGTYVTFRGKTFTTENVLSTKKLREKKTVNNPLYAEEEELLSNYTPTKDQNVLYFGFGNNPEDYQRYTENPVYAGANYDGNGVMRTTNIVKGGGVNFDFPNDANQAFDYTLGTARAKVTGPYITQSSYSGCVTRRFVFGETNDTIASVGSLKFKPSNAEVFQVRFKLENLKLRSDIDSVDAGARKRAVALQYFKNNATSATRNSNTYGGAIVSDKYMTVTLDLDSGFRNADVITKILVEFHGFVKSNDSKDAYITLDYVYVGPRASMPTKDDSYLFFNYTDSAAARYRYASNSYSGYNFDMDTRWNVERKDPASGTTVAVNKTVNTNEGTLNLTFHDWDTQVKSTIFGAYQSNTNPLRYNSAKAEVLQLRVKMDNIKAANSNANPFIRLWYGKDVNGTIQSTYDKAYHLGKNFISDGEYMVITIELFSQAEIDANKGVSGFPTTTFAKAGIITGVRIGFHDFTANVAGTPGEIQVDYIYIGPKSQMPTPHTYAETVTAPTCTEAGSVTYTCTNCGSSYTEVLPATGHKEVPTPAHEPTCTVPGLTEGKHCENCGLVILAQEEIPATGHTVATIPGTPAGCTTPGLTDGTYCNLCELVLTEQTEIPAVGHTVVTIPGTPGDCTSSGMTEGSYCSICKVILTEQVEIPATGHTQVIDPAKAPTCTESGLTAGSHCEICGTVLIAQEVVPATGHSYTYKTVDGLTHTVGCTVCDYTATESHTYENGTCICGEAESKEPIVDEALVINHSLNLASDISINFAVRTNYLQDYVNHYLVCEIPVYTGNEQTGSKTVTIEPVLVGNFYYYTLTGITAVQMGDVVTARLHMEKKGQPYLSKADTYSIAQYAYAQLNKDTTADSLKALCAALLRYGKEAQVFKSYRTDAFVDAAMTEAHKAYLSDAEAVTFGSNNQVLADLQAPAVTWVGKALDLDSKVCLKYVFTPATYTGAVEDLVLKVRYVNHSGEAVEVILTDPVLYNSAMNSYAFTFDGLLAAELRTVLDAAVYAGDTRLSQTLRYSPDTYGNGKTGQLLTLCKALFAYSDTAKAYFA